MPSFLVPPVASFALPASRAALALCVLMLAAVAHAETALRSIDVKRAGDAFVVDAVFFAPVPPALASDVLTDFEHFDRFVPNVRSSRVLKREGNFVTLEQKGVARFGLASFPYASEREIEMSPPNSIHSVQAKGSMKRLESLTTIAGESGGTRIAYHIEIVPSLLIANLLSKEFLEHEIEEQFNAIVAEMVRRRN